jgi:type IV pilus biogenesis protein PilP
MGDGTDQGVNATATPTATPSEPASEPDQSEVAALQPSETAPEAEGVQPGAPVEIDPAEAARLAALAAVAPPPRPEQPIVAGLNAPRPAARPRSIAAAARADREAQAARVAAASRQASTPADRQSGGPAPADVARAATVTAGLPAGETGLIGVFASGNDRTALLRLPDGRVTRVRRGDNVEGWTVSSIDDSTVRLTGRGGARTLRVPTR